jgi:hypothetical protein
MIVLATHLNQRPKCLGISPFTNYPTTRAGPHPSNEEVADSEIRGAECTASGIHLVVVVGSGRDVSEQILKLNANTSSGV